MSVAQRRRISTLIAGRFARSLVARASGSTVALSRLWPGRADRLIIAPHDLRTADGDLRTLPCHLPHVDPRLGGLDGFYVARLIKR